MRTLAIVAVLALSACGQRDADFHTLPGLGNYALVVPAEADPATFPVLAKAKCGEQGSCRVFAWTDPAKAAAAMPMTDPEMAALAFSYGINRDTGFERSLWDCRRYPRTDKNECL